MLPYAFTRLRAMYSISISISSYMFLVGKEPYIQHAKTTLLHLQKIVTRILARNETEGET